MVICEVFKRMWLSGMLNLSGGLLSGFARHSWKPLSVELDLRRGVAVRLDPTFA
jgi:hypothetical protein